jgi:hypothetical protein
MSFPQPRQSRRSAVLRQARNRSSRRSTFSLSSESSDMLSMMGFRIVALQGDLPIGLWPDSLLG